MKGRFTISELAREFDVTTRTIRFYEDEGLLAPLRDGQKRIYRARDRVRLQLILRGRRLGFSLAEVREIIDLYDAPAGEERQLRVLMERIAGRRADLERRMQDIQETLTELDQVYRTSQERLTALAGRAPCATAPRGRAERTAGSS